MYHVNEVFQTDAAFPHCFIGLSWFPFLVTVFLPFFHSSSLISLYLSPLSLSLSKHIHCHIDRSYDRLPVKTIGQNQTSMRQ